MAEQPRNILRSPNKVSDEAESLKLIIEEQKQDCSYLLHIYNRMRATEGLLLTAAFGILAYLYRSAGTPVATKTSISQRLSMPSEDYGKVVYLMAAALFAYGLIKLILRVFSKQPWMTAYEMSDDDYTYTPIEAQIPIETLRYYKKRYDKCLKHNGKQYYARKNELNFLFYSILISAIILIVIKTLR